MEMTKLRDLVVLFSLQVLLVSCASIPQNPREVIQGSRFGDRVLWLGQFAFAQRTDTPNGEHLVTGVFRFLKAKVGPYDKLRFPLTASETDGGFFSIGMVLKKEHFEKAVQLERDYGEITPFVLVQGVPERVVKINGLPVVRIHVEEAWIIERSKIIVTANKSLQATAWAPLRSVQAAPELAR